MSLVAQLWSFGYYHFQMLDACVSIELLVSLIGGCYFRYPSPQMSSLRLFYSGVHIRVHIWIATYSAQYEL